MGKFVGHPQAVPDGALLEANGQVEVRVELVTELKTSSESQISLQIKF